MTEKIERILRRISGLALWGLGTLLSAWMWTLDNAPYTRALNELLTKAEQTAGVDLAQGTVWAAWFYEIDTLLFIVCYAGFGLLIARQLARSLRSDIRREQDVRLPAPVLWLVNNLPWVTFWLIAALVVSDLVENATALATLKFDVLSPTVAKVLTVSSKLKGALAAITAVWLVGWTLVWLTGGVLANLEDRKARLAVRDGIIDVLARTRYCLIAVAAYAAFLLGVDQAQDVLTGLTSFENATWPVIWRMVLAVALGVFALHTHSHSVWVWSRLLVRLRGRDGRPEAALGPISTFAKWWGRFLGASPWFIVLILCVRTAANANQVGDTTATWMMLTAGAAATLWGIGFILWKEVESQKSGRAFKHYYSSDVNEVDLLRDKAFRFMGFIAPSPLWMPLVAVVGIVFVRFLYVSESAPVACNALAGVSFAFALWVSIVNRLALNSLRTRFPWILSLFAIAFLLAMAELTQNHSILAGEGISRTSSGAASLQHMFNLTFALSLGLAIVYALWLVLKRMNRPVHHRVIAIFSILAIWVAGVFGYGSRGDGPDAPATIVTSTKRPTLEEAVTNWLTERGRKCAEVSCTSIPVYLVSAEGGGIRAAYFSARVLSELSAVDALQMKDRVFSLSGVSGGSLGVMAWRLCSEGDKPLDCVRPLGAQDLLTPLATAWMYEDALALVLPAGPCELPGCGFLDRGSWFERSLERAIPAFSGPLPDAAPYVFLNATWVETGERAIASRVEIEKKTCVELRHRAMEKGNVAREEFEDCLSTFSAARDQLYEINAPVRASTLAHNSARFPYVNPIGYVKDQGHLADGGYFENSGTQTTADILDEFVRQLTCDREKKRNCPLKDDKTGLVEKVAITAIVIRNGLRNDSDPAQAYCEVPRPRKSQGVLANAAGPPITALNSTGIGTPNRVAQCNLKRALVSLSDRLPKQKSDGSYVEVRLVSENTLYPLGWYLSPAARRGIEEVVEDCVKVKGLGAELQHAPYKLSESKILPCFVRTPVPVLEEQQEQKATL